MKRTGISRRAASTRYNRRLAELRPLMAAKGYCYRGGVWVRAPGARPAARERR